MMWVAIATAIMIGSGAGDDYRAFEVVFEAFEAAVTEVVDEPGCRAEALAGLEQLKSAVQLAKRASTEIAECLARVDRDHAADADDYRVCQTLSEREMARIGAAYVGARARFEAAVPREDWPALDGAVAERLAP